MRYFLDTSAILNGALQKYHFAWISPLVISELENIKNSNKPESVKYLARQAVRDILSSPYYSVYYPEEKRLIKYIKQSKILSDIPDHRILAAADLLRQDAQVSVRFVTSDGALYLFAQTIPYLTAELYEPEKHRKEYWGWNKYTPTEEQFLSIYSDPTINVLNAKTNEFCTLYENDELKDVQFWTGKIYRPLRYKEFTSILGEHIKPRNLEQKMYLDLLQNTDIPVKLCTANFGTGKSYLALHYALHALKQGRFNKIVFVKNNLEVKGAGKLGILPGDEFSKQLPWLRQIEDHIGYQNFEEYIETGLIEPAHLSSLRGRDLKSSAIIVDEAENLLDTNIQLLLGRVAEGSEIIFCADVKQCDYTHYEQSGIPKMIERLAGNENFGMVKLIKTERSKIAAMADLLD